jgi:predicted hotdog family 3-hydroxylacyl-ACP dehydratase
MRFLDEAVALDGTRATCRGAVRPDNPFVRDGAMASMAAVEYIAQAAAALVTSQDPDRGPVRGWLVAARNVVFAPVDVPVGAVLEVEVVEAARVGDFASFDGVVRWDGREVGRGNVKVFKTPEDVA